MFRIFGLILILVGVATIRYRDRISGIYFASDDSTSRKIGNAIQLVVGIVLAATGLYWLVAS